MTKGNLRLVSPRAVIGTVPPRRVPNAELRTREYLTEPEVERLIKAAKANRHGQRDATMILIAFRHGLRAAEIVDLRWDQVDLGRNACLHVRRVKNGMPSVHPLQGDEMRALRELKRSSISPFVFTSERDAPFTTAGFAKMVARAVMRPSSVCIRTCSATPAVMRSPTRATTPERCKPTLGTRTSNIRHRTEPYAV
jgi:integrase